MMEKMVTQKLEPDSDSHSHSGRMRDWMRDSIPHSDPDSHSHSNRDSIFDSRRHKLPHSDPDSDLDSD